MNNNFDDEFDDEIGDDPFGEEFDRDDVVNSRIDFDEEDDSEESDGYSDDEIPDVDVDSILNYDDEKRKKDHFDNDFYSEDEGKQNDEIVQKNFRDFLVVRKISGKLDGIGTDSRIPSERITDSGKKVEISDDPGHDVKSGKKTTVVVNRNEVGDISYIEVLCSCGEKTVIELNIGEEADLADENIDLKEGSGIPDIGLDDNFSELGNLQDVQVENDIYPQYADLITDDESEDS